MIKSFVGLGALALAFAATSVASATDTRVLDDSWIVTASNTSSNQLLIYDSSGTLLEKISTQGQGGVSGNAGGIASSHDRLAVVNFGSMNVASFRRDASGAHFRLDALIPSLANPVSVAYGADHLYILSTTHIESHLIDRFGIRADADGTAALIKADGSAAQVGVLDNQLIITEKSNVIETVNLSYGGAVAGKTTLVANIPVNVNAPFGLATRGNDAYVTIAHANEISLVRHDSVLSVTGSGTQSAPCWVALDGPFLFSANSPSMSISRYVVYGEKIIQDAAVIAQFDDDPTDITYRDGMAAVVHASATESHVSIFTVDEDGVFTLHGLATIGGASTNGIAIVQREPDYFAF